MYAKICKYITDTGIWTPISRDLVVAAMRAAAIADRRDLLIREGRDKFVSVLQDSSDRPEYIIAPELNTLSSRDNKGYIYERRIEVNLQAYTADGGRVAAEATGDALKSRPR
ncbi:MAG TPA: hypothetical protein PLV92_30635 [Pirellulaceae bacterium]|nr:hypothetical protein [Pirellulaceae bacterium]